MVKRLKTDLKTLALAVAKDDEEVQTEQEEHRIVCCLSALNFLINDDLNLAFSLKSDLVRVVLDLISLIDVEEYDALGEEHFLGTPSGAWPP